MSGPESGFLARWSRRKLAQRQGTALPDGDRPADAPVPSSAAAALSEEPAPAGEAAASGLPVSDPPAPLPRIEDLTAESDISAFLRDDVPAALRTAALRRIWSLDPDIRDHVGLCENAWDFNDPDAIPGFGSPAALARLVARASGGLADPGAASAHPSGAEGATCDRSTAGPPGSVPPTIREVAGADRAQDSLRRPEAPTRLSASTESGTAAPGRRDAPGQTRPPAPSRHGGALPR